LKYFLLVLTAVLLLCHSHAQPLYNDATLLTDTALIKGAQYALSEPGTNVAAGKQLFAPVPVLASATLPEQWINQQISLQWEVANTGTAMLSLSFFPGHGYKKLQGYYVLPGGTLLPFACQNPPNGCLEFSVAPRSKVSLLAVLQPAQLPNVSFWPLLMPGKQVPVYLKTQHHQKDAGIITGYLLSGILLMMFFFSLSNFLLSYKKEFLYNSIYVCCVFFICFFSTFFAQKPGYFSAFFYDYLSFVLLITGTFFYVQFTRTFLKTPQTLPRFNKLLVIEQWVLLAAFVSFNVLYVMGTQTYLKLLLENSTKIFCLSIGLVYIAVALLQKNRLMNYLATGNAMLIGFSVVSLVLLQLPQRPTSLFGSPVFYFELGVVSELLFFLLGLTYKNRVELIERIKEQETLKLKAEKQALESKLDVAQARETERNRISADMHDDLGAGITAIRLYSELAKGRFSQPIPELERISNSANELLVNMNAIIWTMKSSNAGLLDMIAYIRSYASEYFEHTAIKCSIVVAELLPNVRVNSQFRRNVFMVVKESLQNVVKHANATSVDIVLQPVKNGLALTIQDNGIGIDLENRRRYGNGINNMERRMQEMNIQFSVTRQNGTLITLFYEIDFDNLFPLELIKNE
jgi:signal transduction histidine kinase